MRFVARLQAFLLLVLPAATLLLLLRAALAGLLAGTAGIMLAYTNGSFSAAIGDQLLIPSFLGPVLGGTSLLGGSVAVVGTLVGTFLTLTIRYGLQLRGIGLDLLNMALGIVLLVAISAGQIRRSRGRS